ncbi:putative BOI-related E3 ubiquitin-protein ligase 3 [Bidens hawaiensis]|uniref:putative BOI-related E3 ubiquitin-protein ligase 3 n=1 Tax=Bidens hawaiensis TaxID=980011 RepID=UPI00404B5B26
MFHCKAQNHMMMMIDVIGKQYDGKRYRTAAGTTATGETMIPMHYYSSGFNNLDPLKTESDLTYSLPVSRKRYRDFDATCTFSDVHWNPNDACVSSTFLGDDVASQIQRQQLEIDQFVTRHTEKVRREIEEKRRRNSMKLLSALEEGVTHRLKSKEEEIANMTKLNYALEDKVKSLSIENQIWRELAEKNEATANALRMNLKQVLEQVVNSGYGQYHSTPEGEDAVVAEDAQSCCESNNNGNERVLAEQDRMKRLCKCCGEVESSVLLLPCRHLCLCTVCVSNVGICPICKSAKNISVDVHLS